MTKRLIPTLGTCLLGLWFAHHPMILTGFDGIQINHEDPRLINYLLEHSYRWLLGNPLHRDVWSPPFFFPALGVLAYSDSLLSGGPLYWPWRLAGFAADTSFQLWLMTCFALNDLIFFVFLRRIFNLGLWPCLSAFLFAFAGSRVVDVGHPQLLPHFFTVLAILALSEVMVRGANSTPSKRLVLWILAGLSVSAQLFASFYMGWFLVFASMLMLVWGGLIPGIRPTLIERARRDWILILVAGFIASFPTWMLYIRYVEVARTTGYRSFQEVSLAVPKLISWIYMGPHSWLYTWLTRQQPFREFGSLEAAHRIGIGWLTPAVCLAGLASGWNRPSMRLLTVTGLTLFVLVTRIPRWSIEGLALSIWMVCPFAIFEAKARPREQAFAVFLYALLFWLLCPWMALLPVAMLLALWALLARGLTPAQRAMFEKPTAMGICLFPAIPSFMDSPIALLSGALGAMGILLVHRRSSRRLVAWSPMPLITTALALILLLNMTSELNLWKIVYTYVPGGAAIRVSSRVCLLFLVPMAVGFAFFWETQSYRSRPVLLFALALFCILEQGMTTTTYSKRDTRKRVNAIASILRQSRGAEAFFYSSPRPGSTNWNDHVDAMWAGLESGLPSINGYSGHSPRGWSPLYDAAVRNEAERARVGKALDEWIHLEGLGTTRVAWLVADKDGAVPGIQPLIESSRVSKPPGN